MVTYGPRWDIGMPGAGPEIYEDKAYGLQRDYGFVTCS